MTKDHSATRSAWQVQRGVLFALLLRELKTRFGGRWLGVIWVVAEPLAHVLLLMLVFGYLRHRLLSGVDYAMFLVAGLLPFLMFRNVALRLMDAVDSNRGLFGYRQVKPMDAMVSRAVLEVCVYSAVYLLVLGLMGWLGYAVAPARPLELMATSVVLLLGAFGLGLVLAIVTDNVPKARGLVRIAFFPIYLISGVILPVQALPAEVLPWLLWNPVLHALEISRGLFFRGYTTVSDASAAFVFACALVALALGLSLYRVRRHRLLAT